jgi:hypothetical protein
LKHIKSNIQNFEFNTYKKLTHLYYKVATGAAQGDEAAAAIFVGDEHCTLAYYKQECKSICNRPRASRLLVLVMLTCWH